jgi:hypothetical protein
MSPYTKVLRMRIKVWIDCQVRRKRRPVQVDEVQQWLLLEEKIISEVSRSAPNAACASRLELT